MVNVLEAQLFDDFLCWLVPGRQVSLLKDLAEILSLFAFSEPIC